MSTGEGPDQINCASVQTDLGMFAFIKESDIVSGEVPLSKLFASLLKRGLQFTF